jgi:hypothetical protein
MDSRTTCMILVCLLFLGAICVPEAPAWNLTQAAFVEPKEAAQSPAEPARKAITKVKAKPIVKCRPVESGYAATFGFDPAATCVLPMDRPNGWAIDAEALFARTRGKVRYLTGVNASSINFEDVDMNGDMGLPDHAVIGSFSARYRFAPSWSVKYSIMPMLNEGGGTAGRSFNFGNQNFIAYGQPTNVKWERLYQRLGIVYDAKRTYATRLSVVGDLVRVNDKISFYQPGLMGGTMDNDLLMGMAGIEFERCLKTTRSCSTLSLECKAGVAFGDQAFGADMSSGIKYSIPLNNGRWGFVKGGYQYVTYKKKYSDAKSIDTCIDGGFLQMGFVF